jgi:hypothetical protein
MYVCMHVLCMYVFMYVCMYVCIMYVCMCVCMNVCIYVCMYIQFSWQSWGNYVQMSQGVVTYGLLLLVLAIYCWFGHELTLQVT